MASQCILPEIRSLSELPGLFHKPAQKHGTGHLDGGRGFQLDNRGLNLPGNSEEGNHKNEDHFSGFNF
jgi:hypothetical protein